MDITSVNAIPALLATGIEITKLDRATDPFVIDLRTLMRHHHRQTGWLLRRKSLKRNINFIDGRPH